MDLDFFKNKKVLITGHTGFKGSWLSLWLTHLGADVCGYALKPETIPSMFEKLHLSKSIQSIYGDIRDRESLQKIFCAFRPEIVFHLAAQPLVRLSYAQPLLTYETNVIGTLSVMEAARNAESVRAFVNVTTDKCYENKEVFTPYSEDDPMGGHDMYSSSKGCVEIMSSSYRKSFLMDSYSMATARSGNVIGGGDWAKDRLIPDTIRAIFANKPIEIRSPHSIRPWQHVLDPLYGYLLLAYNLYSQGHKFAQSYNFGPDPNNPLTVLEVIETVIKNLGEGIIKINSDSKDKLHESKLLLLNNAKAKQHLGWSPKYNSQEAIAMTANWYKNFYNSESNVHSFSLEQIKAYEKFVCAELNLTKQVTER